MKKLIKIFILFFLSLGVLWITLSSAIYFKLNQISPFVLEKLPLSSPNLFVWVLRSHVVSSIFSLTACLILSSSTLLKKSPSFHRILGRVNALFIFLILCPSGFYLSFSSRGGMIGSLGFMLSAIIVLFCMAKAIQSIKNKKISEHRRYTLHVLGQLSVAVISRVFLFILEPYSSNPDLLYNLCLWIPVLSIFGFIEFFKFRYNSAGNLSSSLSLNIHSI